MSRSKNRLKEAQAQTETAIREANKKIEELGEHSSEIYYRLDAIQKQFNRISNKPHELGAQCEELKKIRLTWKQQDEKIEKDYEIAKAKAGIGGAAGVGIGGAVVGLGPSAAMGVATTFGVASTGTAISSLSGAAATNAALAWLGGGTLAAGGGGMAAGEALLALAGPVGWAIAGVSLLASAFAIFKAKNDTDRLNDIYCLISKRDTKKYELAIVELNERISHIVDESGKLERALETTKSFGTNYSAMSESQRYELCSYVNLMKASTLLLINPILGLQPDYTEDDLEEYIKSKGLSQSCFFSNHKKLIVGLCNMLYSIWIDDIDIKLLTKSLAGNKEFLKASNITKSEFKDNNVVDKACKALDYKKKGA